MDVCPNWESIQRSVDRETDAAERSRAAGHVRSCASCDAALRDLLRLRRAIRSLPAAPLSERLAERYQRLFWAQRDLSLRQWLRRSTAIAASIMVAGLLAPTLLASRSTEGLEGLDPALVTPAEQEQVDSAQSVVHWIVRDLSRG